MADIRINDFSGGWMPGEDPIQGRRNGLLQMDNLELDSNGALSLAGGTLVKQSGFPANAHTIFSRLINGARADYSILTDGSIYRNGSSIASGGDATNGAFGTAFNFTLIASGNKRYKDNGTTLVNLGVGPASAAPTLAYSTSNSPYAVVAAVTGAMAVPTGFGSAVVVGSYLQMTANASGVWAIQTNGGSLSNLNSLAGVGGGPNIGYGTDDDYIQIVGYTPIVTGRSLNVDILLVAGGGAGAVVSDYYTYEIGELSAVTYSSVTGTFTWKMRRKDFIRVGGGSQDWSTTYGVRLSYSGGEASEVVNILGNGVSSPTMYMLGGSKSQNGTYQYLQVNVNNTGSYLAKSIAGPLSNQITLDMGQVLLTPQDPSGIDAQVNEVWIFRRGGLLDKWYRVKVITSSYATPVYDTLSDIDALSLNIYLNTNLVSVAYTTIADKIYDIIGPVNGRWYYFTTNFMYPSDINNPDLVDPNIAVRITGSNSELLMWARQISDSVILVGTSVDVYSLSGTFATFPDFSIDAYYRSLKCKYPPLTCDAEVYGGLVFYLANDGWRSLSSSGDNPSLVSPTLDRLYRGETVSGYINPMLKVIPRSVRFPIVLAKNKMYCFITGIATPRIEVYDFIRQYWRPVLYGLGDVTAATHTQDGQVLAFFADKKLREIDIQSSKLIDAATKQVITIKTLVFDGATPRQRKDSSSYKIRLQASDNITNNLIVDGSATVNSVGTATTSSVILDQAFDLSSIANVAVVKTYQASLTGTVNLFILDDISINYDLRPEQRHFIRVQGENYGIVGRKRFYSIPFQIDTLGNSVTITPIVDGSNQTGLVVNSSRKQSFDYQFAISGGDIVKGVDYEYTIHSTGLFEFFGFGTPKNIEVFPEQRLSLVIPVTNFGTPARKRLRMWPFILDTLGFDVTLTPLIDGVSGTPVTYNCNGKKTVYLYETSDAIGVDFSGIFSGTNPFELWDIGTPLQIERYPEPVKYFMIPVTNLGSASKKRIRVWPFVLSSPTAANSVTFHPLVDGVSTTSTVFSIGVEKQTFRHFYKTDVFGVDYSGYFTSTSPFEVGDILQPEIVQTLPIAKQFDQVGPEEFFRYGKLKQIEFRILAEGTSIPYTIYFNDNSTFVDSITTIANKENSYFLMLPKGVSGNIMRIELGPTSFDFHRFYTRLQVAKSGSDSELAWINL